MATYRVGEAGATVFTADGSPIATLRPGYVVVEGRVKDVGSLADQYLRQHEEHPTRKRMRAYSDKAIHPPEDKSL